MAKTLPLRYPLSVIRYFRLLTASSPIESGFTPVRPALAPPTAAIPGWLSKNTTWFSQYSTASALLSASTSLATSYSSTASSRRNALNTVLPPFATNIVALFAMAAVAMPPRAVPVPVALPGKASTSQPVYFIAVKLGTEFGVVKI